MAKILVTEDDDVVRKLVTRVITFLNHEVVAVADGAVGLSRILIQDFDLVVTDEEMGGGDKEGSRMLQRAAEASRPAKRVIMTSSRFRDFKGEARLEAELRKKWGVTWLTLLPKPLDLNELEAAVECILALPA